MRDAPLNQTEAIHLATAWIASAHEAANQQAAEHGYPPFTLTDAPEFFRDSRNRPHFDHLIKGSSNDQFVLIAVILKEDDGWFPLVYLTERHQRTAPYPSGWGCCQPYGRRLTQGGVVKIPTPDFSKLGKAIRTRMDQIAASSAAPAGVADQSMEASRQSAGILGCELPDGVFCFHDPSSGLGTEATSFFLHIPGLLVSQDTAERVLRILSSGGVLPEDEPVNKRSGQDCQETTKPGGGDVEAGEAVS